MGHGRFSRSGLRVKVKPLSGVKMVCHVCGTSNDWDAAFCIICGKSLRSLQSLKQFFKTKWLRKSFLHQALSVLQGFINPSFHHRVNFKMIRWIHGLSILCAGFIALLFIIAGFHLSRLFGIVTLLIGVPLIFVFMVLYSRLVLEMILREHQPSDRVDPKEILPQSTDEIEWKV